MSFWKCQNIKLSNEVENLKFKYQYIDAIKLLIIIRLNTNDGLSTRPVLLYCHLGF